MRRFSRSSTILLAGVVGLVAMLGAAVLVQPASAASVVDFRPGGPMCGPTILWICSGSGGPDVLIGLTVCEKREFERETGMTCVPYPG